MGTESKNGRGPRLRDVAIIIVLLVVLTLLALPVVRTTMNTTLSRSCQGNLKEWGAIFAVYRTEQKNINPPPHGFETFGPANNALGCTNIDDAFDFAPDLRLIFPEYATDTTILACPEAGGVIPAMTVGPAVLKAPRLDPKTFGIAEGSCEAAGSITRPSAGYTYFGFEMRYANDDHAQVSEEQARQCGLPAAGPANVVGMLEQFQVDEDTDIAKAQSLRSTAFNRGDYMQPLGWPYVPYGGDLGLAMVGPLNDVTATSNVTAVALVGFDNSEAKPDFSAMAVMWDTIHQDASGNPVFSHDAPKGCNVLFMDGHAEFKEYPGLFPVSKSFAAMKAVR
jgi:prepilin-type processing-associated H-X9-DG protein